MVGSRVSVLSMVTVEYACSWPPLPSDKRLFETKRKDQLNALKNLVELNDINQQYKIIDIMLKGLFKVGCVRVHSLVVWSEQQIKAQTRPKTKAQSSFSSSPPLILYPFFSRHLELFFFVFVWYCTFPAFVFPLCMRRIHSSYFIFCVCAPLCLLLKVCDAVGGLEEGSVLFQHTEKRGHKRLCTWHFINISFQWKTTWHKTRRSTFLCSQ